MIEQLFKSLLELYNQDIREYTDMNSKMREFSSFLFETNKGALDIKVDEDENSVSVNQKKIKGEKSPIEENSLESDLDQYDKTIQQFSAYREQLFARLKERADRSNAIQARACAEIGEDTFQISKFKPFIEENLYNQLASLTESLREEMAGILEMDKKILEKLQAELNVLRLEVYRIEGVKKTRNAYEQKTNMDARFIDRTE